MARHLHVMVRLEPDQVAAIRAAASEPWAGAGLTGRVQAIVDSWVEREMECVWCDPVMEQLAGTTEAEPDAGTE
jgi:hypothetical protein